MYTGKCTSGLHNGMRSMYIGKYTCIQASVLVACIMACGVCI